MTKKLQNVFNYIFLAGIVFVFPENIHAQCTSLALPYSENFTSVSLGASCSWTASSASSGAGWSKDATAYAGGTSPEMQAYGNNACAGCVETVSLTLASPLNTSTVTSLELSFKHKLYVTNQATSGPASGTLKMQTSANGTVWTDRWTHSYTMSGTSLTSVASGTISVPAFNPSSNDTYIRFTITGVMFKVWGWQIDDVSAVSPVTTGIQTKELTNISVLYPNPVNSVVHIKLDENKLVSKAYSVKVVDVLGKEVLNEVYKENIDLSILEKGIYFLNLYGDNQLIETKKIIKE